MENPKILLVNEPLNAHKVTLHGPEIFRSRSLQASFNVVCQHSPDIVVCFVKDREPPFEEHLMTWLIEGFRGKLIVFDAYNKVKDHTILVETQILDEYFSGPVSPQRFEAIVKSQLTRGLQFASPRAMITFDLFRNLFDRGLNPLFMFNEELSRCLAANIRAEQLTGHNLKALRSLGLKDLIAKNNLPEILKIIRRARRQYYDSTGQSVLIDSEGQKRPVDFSCGVFNFGRKSFVKMEFQNQKG